MDKEESISREDKYKHFTSKNDASEIFETIHNELKDDLKKDVSDELVKMMFDSALTKDDNVRMLITIRDAQGALRSYKYKIGNGQTLRQINLAEEDKYPQFVTKDEAAQIFHTIIKDCREELEERIKDELDEYISDIYKILDGKTDVRFLIYVPLKNKSVKELQYKIGSGKVLQLIKLGRRTPIYYIKEYGRHLLEHKLYYGLVILIGLLVAGYNTKDMIKVIHTFDPTVTNKIYDVFVILLNITDGANK